MNEILEWLLDSDPALQYQAYRDLVGKMPARLRNTGLDESNSFPISVLLGHEQADGFWGKNAYNPKWTCTHYVLYELVQLGVDIRQRRCLDACAYILGYPDGKDGGINYAKTVDMSDVCVNGIILTILSYFMIEAGKLEKIVDYLLKVQMEDGGWNCEYHHGAVHSSMCTTICALEGLFHHQGFSAYRKREIQRAAKRGVEFLLKHKLYKSDRTGETIRDDFLVFHFPVRYKYDILRCLDLFRKFNIPFDERMNPALDAIEGSESRRGTWEIRSQPGQTYYSIEKNGSESKWNTLRALRVLIHYKRREALA